MSSQQLTIITLEYLKSMNRAICIGIILLSMVRCKPEGSVFKNVPPKQSGVDFINQVTATDELNILDYLYFYNGGGVSIGDINNDGLPDIYLTANQLKNKLYLNKGNLQFEDITTTAGVAGNSTWNTGTVMADVNNDGFLDIYVCTVVGINGFDGHNELFINNGDNTFSEQSAKYGLDFDTYSSSAAFFDYDLDGDLDMYLLNHAVHTPESFGKVDLRNRRTYETGDRLMRNDGTTFTDVSEEAGIYGGINGYGLGLNISDFNKDGYPDIYVGNDFHEDDYYYINQGDGTFKNELTAYFGHTSRFSMGNDAADINHDGWPDLMSLDMLPQEEKSIKSTEGDDSYQTLQLRTKQFGYHYQYTRNMLYINQKNTPYLETALLSGVAATDWSWSVLIEDYNQDGNQDMFISNGIPKRPNDLDFIKFVSSEKIRKKINQTKLVDQEALNMMPSGKTHNYVYEGTGTLAFNDQSGKWLVKDNLVSGATAFGDLDNDGDLDLVINNLNESALILENKTNASANYLKLAFKSTEQNAKGIGTKVYSYHNGILQYKELTTTRGFQASSEPIVHFGYGQHTTIDSIKIVWPNQKEQMLRSIAVNQTLLIDDNKAQKNNQNVYESSANLFTKVEDNLGIDFVHKEDAYVDFHRQRLIPYKVSEQGPALAVGDLNHDGTEDIFLGSSHRQPSRIYLQKEGLFQLQKSKTVYQDSIAEDVSATIMDINNDKKSDLLVATAGSVFPENHISMSTRLYLQEDAQFGKAKTIEDIFGNSSIIISDEEYVFVGGHTVTNKYGEIPNSYILRKENGTLKKIQEFPLGMITDAIWSDFNQDGKKDLIVVGEWMTPLFLEYQQGTFVEQEVSGELLSGLWQSIISYDIDQDGDIDYLLGNWGTNSKLTASSKFPLKLYYNDFNKDGVYDPIVTINKHGDEYAITTFDDLALQMPDLRKKYNTYQDFAGQTVVQIFGKEVIEKSETFEVQTLASGYLKNEKGNFYFVPFQEELQLAPIKTFVKYDFDHDGKQEVLTAGNFFGVIPYHGRFDSFPGALIQSDAQIQLGNTLGLDFQFKSARHLTIIHINKKPYLLATFNNEKVQLYEF